MQRRWRRRLRIRPRTTRDGAGKSHAVLAMETGGIEMAVADTEAEAATERRERDAATGAAVVTGNTETADNGVARERAGLVGKKGGTEDTEAAVVAGTVGDAGIGMIDLDTAAAQDLQSADMQGVSEAHAGDSASDTLGSLPDCIC